MGRGPERRLRGSLGGLAALLAAAMLSSCFLLTQAQKISVTLSPASPILGQDILLTPGGKSGFVVCSWYRGRNAETNLILTYVPAFTPPQTQLGRCYTGREMTGPGCYLRIINLMLNDTEKYIVTKTVSHGPERGEVYLEVKGSSKVSNALIAGSVVGAVVGATLIGTLLYYRFRLYTQRRSQRASKSSPLQSVPENTSTV